jgi:hypothetical protein
MVDGPLQLSILANDRYLPPPPEGCGGPQPPCPHGGDQATFTVPALADQGNRQVTIKRTKKRVVAIYQYDGRITLTANVQLWLDQFKTGEIILTHRGVIQTTGLGHQVIKVTIPRKVIARKCKRYPHCSVLAVGRTWSGSYAVDQGTNARQRVK